MLEEMKKISVAIFNSVLKVSADHSGTFRLLITTQIDNAVKPLLLVGNAHGSVEDGHIISVLNPDKDLLDQVVAGCAYSPAILKDLVQGKCDAMLELWIDAYKKDGVNGLSSYTARESKPAKFSVK